MKRHERGFTLVEISVALLALGLVLLAAVVFWQQSERQRVTVRQMEVQDQSRDAVLGFVQAHHRLPCPAADTGGPRTVPRARWATCPGAPWVCHDPKPGSCAMACTERRRPRRRTTGT